jgi:hypothetical protein
LAINRRSHDGLRGRLKPLPGIAMAMRKRPSQTVQDEVLVACRRKCCLCYCLLDEQGPRKGQIAHLNQKREDDRLENLVWLCFDHHDEFDSTTRQSKGLTAGEIRRHRDRMVAELNAKYGKVPFSAADAEEEAQTPAGQRHPWRHPWRFPLWMTADRPELFAYTAPAADGICAIERINLPDGRIVIACIQMPGNPGNSITNCVEYIRAELCERFDIDPANLVWLENYEYFDREEWKMVRFTPSTDHELDEPAWETMTIVMWSKLGLSPRKRVTANASGELRSKIKKHFPWPPTDPVLGLD